MNFEAKAQLNQLRVAPRKVRLLIDLIRGMNIEQAINQLELSKKHASRPVIKLLNSAAANALHNHDLKKETLGIKTAFVNDGQTLHRWMPRAMGRATPIRKRTSHITLILEGEMKEKVKTKKDKEEKNEDVVDAQTVEEVKVKSEKKVAKKPVKKAKTIKAE